MTEAQVLTEAQLDEIGFRVEFHSYFRVGAAYPLDGLDAVVDAEEPLPADHLKGVMLAEARGLFGGAAGPMVKLLEQTFGSTRWPSPWSWVSAEPESEWKLGVVRQRVKVQPEKMAALKDHLVSGSLAWTSYARFCVVQALPLKADDAARQAALLRLAGRSVHHLGSWRRRGLGWVGVHVEGDPEDDAELAQLIARDLKAVREPPAEKATS